ncbi:MAG: hypothetical protein JO043_06640, partial [Candidatus Eremiobacteraeota bacterium]|nr:hypothetical protein [Candidatus Eremiobacteraeota bacterium]
MVSAAVPVLAGGAVQAPLHQQTIYRGELSPNPALARRGARKSYGIRRWRGVKRMLTYYSQIQHVVVIDMENRSLDNLFAAYYGHPWRNTTEQWQDMMNIANPAGPPALTPNPLSTDKAHSFDPHHGHDSGWNVETVGGWGAEKFGCGQLPCPPNATAYSYVPIPGA